VASITFFLSVSFDQTFLSKRKVCLQKLSKKAPAFMRGDELLIVGRLLRSSQLRLHLKFFFGVEFKSPTTHP
jgi:hypothetical protein